MYFISKMRFKNSLKRPNTKEKVTLKSEPVN